MNKVYSYYKGCGSWQSRKKSPGLVINVIKLRGTLKDLCIGNDAGVFFSAKKGLTATPKSAAAFATDCF